MGKKKHKDKHPQETHAQDRHARDKHGADAMHFAVPPQVAGIAAMVLGQVNSPAGRQMIAGVLNRAADAIAGKTAAPQSAAPVTPAPPVPPVPPVPPEPRAAYAPKFETSTVTLPPEAARVVEAAASVLEGWAQKLARPKPPAGG